MAEVIPLDPVAAVFGQSGDLARAFPGYAPRDGQVAMARLVHETVRDGGGCLADAPCGTGKSLAGFFEESLPRAVLALRQGVGRLIRSTGDWGCVVLCDPRLTSKGYGAEAVRALALPTRTRSVAEACAWLAQGVTERIGRNECGTNEERVA